MSSLCFSHGLKKQSCRLNKEDGSLANHVKIVGSNVGQANQ
jgi:hypothetical protein